MSGTYLSKFAETGKLRLSGMEPIEKIKLLKELKELLPGGSKHNQHKHNPYIMLYGIEGILNRIEIDTADASADSLTTEFDIAYKFAFSDEISDNTAKRQLILIHVEYLVKKLIELLFSHNDESANREMLQERLEYLGREAARIKEILEA